MERGGRPVATGRNQKTILHALVLSRGQISREALEDLLPNRTLALEERQKAIRNTLSYLRKKLELTVEENGNPVVMRRDPLVSIDLWDFFELAELKDYEAAKLLAGRGEPWIDPDGRHNELWDETLAAFTRYREAALKAVETTSKRHRSMLDTRTRLLARALVPGVGREISIGEVRDRLERLPVPWSSLRPEACSEGTLLSDHIADLLAATGDAPPRQAILTGGPGAGKTLTAISTFLRLTDSLERLTPGAEQRTVLYVDAHAEGSRPDFATDAWFECRLHEADAVAQGRPIVIMAHGDAFLSRRSHKLEEVLSWRLFRDSDILLCCGEQFYSKELRYVDYGTHVLQLGPWDADLQRAFAEAVFDRQTHEAFVGWRNTDTSGTRAKLCTVPLHFVHVLPLVGADPQVLERISTHWHLYDQVARMRLRVAGHSDSTLPKLMEELGAIAHRFYIPGTPDVPIGFNADELREYLRQLLRTRVESRAETVVNRTLLIDPPPGSDELRFEEPSWGWFFVARHLTQTLIYRPRDVLKGLAKLLSADVMEMCEEMVRDAMLRHGDPILASLWFALCEDTATSLSSSQRTIAREQSGYLLGVVANSQVREMLSALVDPESETWEKDDLVRRGIAFGLANGGASEFADRYVQALREELERGDCTPQRDANIGFLLSLRGDQPLDPDRPGEIGVDVNPVRTVADLVRGLKEGKHAGSWRIKLFTLIDLGRHPAISAECFREAIAPHLERLSLIAEELQEDPDRGGWIELTEIRAVLDEQSALAA